MNKEELNKRLNEAFGLEPKDECTLCYKHSLKCLDCGYFAEKYIDFTLPENKDKLEELIMDEFEDLLYSKFEYYMTNGSKTMYKCYVDFRGDHFRKSGLSLDTKQEALVSVAIQVSDKLKQKAQKIDWSR